jgi:hypothetical protein
MTGYGRLFSFGPHAVGGFGNEEFPSRVQSNPYEDGKQLDPIGDGNVESARRRCLDSPY